MRLMPNSTRKLKDTNPTIMMYIIFLPENDGIYSETKVFKLPLIHKEPRINRAVFNTGTVAEATNTATYLFFLDINLYRMPATNPAAIPLSKIVTQAKNGLSFNTYAVKKLVPVTPDISTTKPKTKPKNNPATGPRIIAPSVIGISTKLRLSPATPIGIALPHI